VNYYVQCSGNGGQKHNIIRAMERKQSVLKEKTQMREHQRRRESAYNEEEEEELNA